jgi:WD40 repeat protein
MWGSREAAESAIAAEPTKTRTAAEDSAGLPALPPPPHRLVAPLQRRDPDRYQLLGEHGRGGLGTVTRAHDKELGRNVAIKELIKRGDAGEVRFLREAMITARLEHPGIVPVHEAGQWPDGTPFYVMKLVAGRSLKEMIAKCASVACRMALLHHVVAVADAVAYAHKRRIIHRDLKPANVIVGDFGETVVIDWGLAKDLSELDDVSPADDRSPYRAPAIDDLTQAGSVLGTPMYMAPEQWRGERVDQRADVFAIGAMLWELCSRHRVPPAEPRQRDKLLRRANIDGDLIAIIGKALAGNPADRYQNAGELAADLRAFTSHTRIASRRYSLAGVAIHWIRHHRAIAAIAAAALVLGVIGATVYVRNVGVARDRAERANDELVLQNADLLMQRDPTAVVDALAAYRGKDKVRKDRLLAEAHGHGVADARFKAHQDTVYVLHRKPDGSVYSLGEDRRLVVTRNNLPRTLAVDVAAADVYAYRKGIPLLAYAAAPTGIVVRDLETGTVKRFGTRNPLNLAISSTGALLAALDARGTVTVWELATSTAIYEAQAGGAELIDFTGETLVLKSKTSLQTIDFSGGRPTVTSKSVASVSFHGEGGLVATGDDQGRIALRDQTLELIAELAVCREPVHSTRVVEPARLVVFACEDQVAGVARYDVQRRSLTIEYTLRVKGTPTFADTDPEGRQLFVVVDPSTIVVADVETRITRTYQGQPGRITAIDLPTRHSPGVVTADSDGHVRVWPLASSPSRVVFKADAPVFGASTSPDGHTTVTGGSTVRRIDNATTVVELPGHTVGVLRTRFASDGRTFFSIGYDGTVRVWDPRTNNAMRVFSGHRGAVNDAEYSTRGDRIISAGADGQLLAWSTTGTASSVLLARSTSLNAIEVLNVSGHVVVCDSENVVLDVAPDGKSRAITTASADAITLLRASPDGTMLAIGRASGTASIYATATHRVLREIKMATAVHQIQFDPKNRDVAIQSDGGVVRIVPLGPDRFPWQELAGSARDVAYSPDGETLAIVDRANWFYSIRDQRWLNAPDHAAVTISGHFTPDGNRFISSDITGALVAREVREIPKRLMWSGL